MQENRPNHLRPFAASLAGILSLSFFLLVVAVETIAAVVVVAVHAISWHVWP